MPKTLRSLVLGIFAALVFLYPLVPYYHGIVMGVVSVPIYLLYVAIDDDARERLIEGVLDMRKSRTTLAIGLIMVWTFLSAAWSLGPLDSVGIGILYLFLTNLFFVVKYEFNDEWMRKLFLTVYYASVVMVTGLLFWQFIQTRTQHIPFDRVRNIATLENVNNLAVYCAMGFFAGLSMLFHDKRTESMIKFGILTLLSFMGVMLALSRAVLLMVMIGLFYIIIKYNKKLIWILAVFGILVATVPTIRHRALDVFSYEQNVSRVKIWMTSIDMSKKYPIGGTGGLAYRYAYVEYKENHPELFNGWDIPVVWHAHNMFLRFSSELGIPGLIMCIIMVIWSIKTCTGIENDPRTDNVTMGTYQGIKMAIIIFYGANMLDCYFEAPKPLFTFYLLMAISQSYAYRHGIES